MRPNKRDELVHRALDVFYRNGFHATGHVGGFARDLPTESLIVNESVHRNSNNASVAATPNGGFVVAWDSLDNNAARTGDVKRYVGARVPEADDQDGAVG